MNVKFTFTQPLLGTLAGNPDIATEYIAGKHPNGVQADEAEVIAGAAEQLEKSSTIFPRENGRPFMWDYQVKGFFKKAAEQMIQSGTIDEKKLKKDRLSQWMHKKTIDTQLFVFPRKIFLHSEGYDWEKPDWIERPLRGQTARGERICLARSETAPIGTTCEMEIRVLAEYLVPYLEPWLSYGALHGMLQWRNSGMGRFSYEVIDKLVAVG